jgi:hypothetical protein
LQDFKGILSSKTTRLISTSKASIDTAVQDISNGTFHERTLPYRIDFWMVENKNRHFIYISVDRSNNKEESPCPKYPEDPPVEEQVQSAANKFKLTITPINQA